MENFLENSGMAITPELNDFYSKSFLENGSSALTDVIPNNSQPANTGDDSLDSIINKINNLSSSSIKDLSTAQQTFENPLNDAKIFAYNPTYKGLNYDRYSRMPEFDELGFNPFRDNEKLYNQESNFFTEGYRALQGFGELTWSAGKNTAIDLGRMLSGDFDPSIDAARESEKIMAETMSSKGTFGSSVLNFGINAGFTAGIVLEMIAEEAAIMGVSALFAPETLGGSLAAGGALATINAGMKATKIGDAFRNMGKFAKALSNLDDVNNARRLFYQAGKGTVDFLNPLRNTTDFIKGINNVEDLKGMGQLALASKGFGSFFRDVRDINRSFSEARIEGGFVQNKMFEDLSNEYYAKNGKMPEGDDLKEIQDISQKAGITNQMINLPVIHYTNNIVFGNLTKPLKGLVGDVAQSFKLLGKDLIYNPKTFFSVAEKGFIASSKRMFNPKTLGLNSIKYFEANVAEGLQESFQESSAIAVEDYYKKVYFNDRSMGRKTYELSYLDSFGKGVSEQFSRQGLETFMSGFLMGGVTHAVSTRLNATTNSIKENWYKGSDAYYERLSKKQNLTPEQKEKVDAAALRKQAREDAKAANDVKITTIVNDLNEMFKDAGKMFSPDLENMSAQEIIAKKMKEAEKNGDKKFLIDYADTSLMKNVYTAIHTGKYNTFIDHLQKMMQLSDEELAQDMGIQDGGSARERLSVSIERAKEIKKRFDLAPKNPVNVNNYKDPEARNQAVFLYNGFEKAKQDLIFKPYSFDRKLERMRSITGEFAKVDLIANADAGPLMHLFGVDSIATEMGLLEKEIETLRQGDASQKSEATKKQKQFNDLVELSNKIKEFKELEDKYGRISSTVNEEDAERASNYHSDAEIKKTEGLLKKAFIKYLSTHSDINNKVLKAHNLDTAYKLFADYYRLNSDLDFLSKSIATITTPDFLANEATRLAEVFRNVHENRKDEIKKSVEFFVKHQIGLNAVFQKLYDNGYAADPEQAVKYNLSLGRKKITTFYYIKDNTKVNKQEDIDKINEIFRDYEHIAGITATEEAERKQAEEEQQARIKAEEEERERLRQEEPLALYDADTQDKLRQAYDEYENKDVESIEEFIKYSPEADRIIKNAKPVEETPEEAQSSTLGFENLGKIGNQGLTIMEDSIVKKGKFIISGISKATPEQKQKIDDNIEELKKKYPEKNITSKVVDDNLIIESGNITPASDVEEQSEIVGEEEQPTKKELSDYEKEKEKFTLTLRITPRIRTHWDSEKKNWRFFNTKGKEIKSPIQIRKYSSILTKMPNVINVWWDQLLDNNSRKEVQNYAQRLLDYYEESRENSNVIYMDIETFLISNLVNKKFKNNKDLSENLTDVNLKKWTKEGLTSIDALDNFAIAIKEDLKENGFSQYDEQDIMNMVLDIIQQYPNGITKKMYESILKESNRNTKLITLVEDFTEDFGLDIEDLVINLEPLIKNFERNEEDPTEFSGKPTGFESLPGFEETLTEEELIKTTAKKEFPLAKSLQGKVIYVTSGIGKTTLVNEYPDQFVDMDVMLVEEFKDVPGFENVTTENFPVLISRFFAENENANTIVDEKYRKAFDKAKATGKTVLTGSSRFASGKRSGRFADVVLKGASDKELEKNLKTKNPELTKEEIQERIKTIRKDESKLGVVEVDKNTFLNFLQGNFDFNSAIDKTVSNTDIQNLEQFMDSSVPLEVFEKYMKKFEEIQMKEQWYDALDQGDVIELLSPDLQKSFSLIVSGRDKDNIVTFEKNKNNIFGITKEKSFRIIAIAKNNDKMDIGKIDPMDNKEAKDNIERVNSNFSVDELTDLMKDLNTSSDDDLINDSENPENCNI